MSLITFEINFVQAWSANCAIASRTLANQGTTFAIADKIPQIPFVTLFRLINNFKCSGGNRCFVLSFQNGLLRIIQIRYFLPTIEIKDYNIMIDGRNFFDLPVENNLWTYVNIQKIATGQEDDCRTACLLGYLCFKK